MFANNWLVENDFQYEKFVLIIIILFQNKYVKGRIS